MIRQKLAEGTVVSSSLPYFVPIVDSVVGPKESESEVIPISYWSARVRAYITRQPVTPSSSSLAVPRVAPLA